MGRETKNTDSLAVDATPATDDVNTSEYTTAPGDITDVTAPESEGNSLGLDDNKEYSVAITSDSDYGLKAGATVIVSGSVADMLIKKGHATSATEIVKAKK